MASKLTLVEHLDELRKRLLVVLISLVIGSAAAFPFANWLLRILKMPGSGVINKLAFFSPQEALMTYIKITVFCGILISLPVVLYEFWAFVSPAVEEKLKKYTFRFVFLSLLAFVIGGLFAYFVLLPTALKFLLNFAGDDLEPIISIDKYITFVVSLVLGGGLVFEMPILSFLLSKTGIITPRILRDKYKYAVLAIFIIAAIITPTPDVFNMLILAAPMLFLYEFSIWVSYFSLPKRKTL